MALFIWTAKVNRRRIALVMAAVLIGLLTLLAVILGGRSAATVAAVSPKGIKTAEDRLSYLSQWGWQAKESEVAVEELHLPREFGPEYEKYLSLQKEQGFDLTDCAGKRVRRYTFDILNYPTGASGVQAHLLLCRSTVVGGEIVGEDFMHGLAMPE